MAEIIEKIGHITSKGQVTIPIEFRRTLGLREGDAIVFRSSGEGSLTITPAKKPTLTELLAGFDPAKHRRGPEDRPWDDAPIGRETI